MIAFIDYYRSVYGFGPICRVLPIAPSTFHAADEPHGAYGICPDALEQALFDRRPVSGGGLVHHSIAAAIWNSDPESGAPEQGSGPRYSCGGRQPVSEATGAHGVKF